MCGCCNRAISAASLRSRASMASVSLRSGAIILIATSRFRLRWRAR
jgi:hypothetical protein